MSSASSPSGVRPCSCPASQIASQTAGPSDGMAPHLVPELARVAGARDDDRDPVVRPDPPDREAEPAEILERRLRRRRPHDLLQELPALRPLHGDVVQLVGRGLHPDLELVPVGELLQPDAVVLVAADEAEVVLAEPVDGRVVDHPAGLVADRGVRHLADREPPRVARDRALDQRLRVRAEHLPLAQRGEVHDRGLLPARPVLRDRSLVVEAVREPVGRGTRRSTSSAREVRGWNEVSRVSTGSASAVTRCAIACENVCSAG